MARPQKDGIDYFPHDTNSFSDLKIKMLRAVHGNDGYAFYFYLLEQIYQQHDFVLDLSDDNTCDDIIACYCLDLGIQKEKFNEILKTCIKYGLFDKELYNSDKKLTSNGIQKRAKTVIDKRKDNAERYNKKKSKTVSESETDSLRSVSGVVSESETNFSGVVSGKFSGVSDSKEKESKEKESKENHHQKDSKIRFADDCDCVADDDFLRSDFENGCGASSADVVVTVNKVSDFKKLTTSTKKNPADMIKSGGILEPDEYCQISKKDIPDIMDIYASKFPEVREILGTGLNKVKLFELMKSYPLAELTAMMWKAKESATSNPVGYFMKLVHETEPNNFEYDEQLPKLEKIIFKLFDKHGYKNPVFQNVEAL